MALSVPRRETSRPWSEHAIAGYEIIQTSQKKSRMLQQLVTMTDRTQTKPRKFLIRALKQRVRRYNRSIRTERRKKHKSFFPMPAVTRPIFPPCFAVWIVTFVHPTQLMICNLVELSAFYSHVFIRSYHIHPGSLTRLYTDTQER